MPSFLSRLFSNSKPSFQIKELARVPSTNDYAIEDHPAEPTLYIAEDQYEGRGQRGNAWHSIPGDITATLFLPNVEVRDTEAFMIAEIAATEIAFVLVQYGADASVKWPNDVMIEEHKVAGILIEQRVSDNWIREVAIGFGINMSPRGPETPTFTPAATGMLSHTWKKKKIDPNRVAKLVAEGIIGSLNTYRTQGMDKIHNFYKEVLFRRDGFHPFFADGMAFRARIKDVQRNGMIVLEKEDGSAKAYRFQEVKHLF